MDKMDLTKKERLIIANQLKILEKLYPEEAEYYAQQRKAVEYGYALHYEDVFEGLYDGLSEEECKEVLDILSMYRALTFSYQRLDDKTGVEESALHFKGFDGNEETRQYSYAQYFIMDLDRFSELTYGSDHPDFNSHWPMLERYREMLNVWKGYRNNHQLNKEQILTILGAY
jgi:uncharacterized protein